jgi:pimeloyl-ACP methyl ester carboxylesterase
MPASAQPSSPAVLVHGAWHGPWCWERVVPLLRKRGVETHLVDLPTMDVEAGYVTDVHSDADALRALLDGLSSPAIVVGHSYGGMVITEGAARHPNVKRLIYLAAFMPDVGESMISLMSQHPNPALVNALRVDAQRRSTLDPAIVGPGFYNDCDEETVAWAREKLRPMLSEGTEPVRAAAWRNMPSTYVVCALDRAILPALQRAMSARATDVVEWETSHSPFASQPELVADLIASFAG